MPAQEHHLGITWALGTEVQEGTQCKPRKSLFPRNTRSSLGSSGRYIREEVCLGRNLHTHTRVPLVPGVFWLCINLEHTPISSKVVMGKYWVQSMDRVAGRREETPSCNRILSYALTEGE